MGNGKYLQCLDDTHNSALMQAFEMGCGAGMTVRESAVSPVALVVGRQEPDVGKTGV